MLLVVVPLARVALPVSERLHSIAVVLVIFPVALVNGAVLVNHAPEAISLPVDDVAFVDITFMPHFNALAVLDLGARQPLAQIPRFVFVDASHRPLLSRPKHLLNLEVVAVVFAKFSELLEGFDVDLTLEELVYDFSSGSLRVVPQHLHSLLRFDHACERLNLHDPSPVLVLFEILGDQRA